MFGRMILIVARGTCLLIQFVRVVLGSLTITLAILIAPNLAIADPQLQPAPAKSGGAQRLAFEEGRRLLEGEREGNLNSRPGAYSQTRLRDGRVLELFYPLTSPASSRTKKRAIGVPGYGLLYASESAYAEAQRPRHILEDLMPDAQHFVGEIPDLIARLEKRLRTGARHLDYSRASLRRIDAYLAAYRRSHTTADTDPAFFQEVTAYYGEVARRELNAEWRVRGESIAQKRVQQVPNIGFDKNGARRDLKPWSSVLNVLYNEDQRSLTLAAAYDADLRAAVQ
jgi:hypothetical protein